MTRSGFTSLFTAMLLVGCGKNSPDDTVPPAPVVLTSIQVVPPDNIVQIGAQTDFTAIAIYSDGFVDATGPITWSSSVPSIATIDSTGVAAGIAEGTTLILAKVPGNDSVVGWGSLVVQPLPPPPCSITTATLPNGRPAQAYSSTLAYSGGSGTPTWSIILGSLPPGLALNAVTGTISGTPMKSGEGITYTFTVQLLAGTVDAKVLSIQIDDLGGIGTT